LGGALNLASSADDACVVVDDYGFLAFVALYFLELEYSNRAYVHTDGIAVTLVQVNYNLNHDVSPAKVDGVV
jgi:hypothetical protein